MNKIIENNKYNKYKKIAKYSKNVIIILYITLTIKLLN